MSRFFLGFLAVAALALVIRQAVAENAASSQNGSMANGGVMIIETYSASANSFASSSDNMQPLPGSPGVEVAPNDTPQPDMVEEDMLVEQTEQ